MLDLEQRKYKLLIESDLKIVTMLFKSESKSDRLLAAYHMQQAIEKSIKLDASRFNLNLWGHNIVRLIYECRQHGVYDYMCIPSEIERKAQMYTSWEANCRYNPSTIVRSDSIAKAYRLCRTYLDNIT